MDVISDVLTSGALPLERYAQVTRRSFPSVLERGGRGVIRRVISITPPASASGVTGGLDTGNQAKVRGFKTIERDMHKIFTPVKLKGKRAERIGMTLMQRIHIRHLSYKRPGARMRRYGGPYYVDKRKFTAMIMQLRSHVGRLAAGWSPAASALKVAVPQWISRHGLGRGTYRADMQGAEMFIESVNHASDHAPTQELRRRVGYALEYQAAAMNREMQHMLLKNAQASGLAVAG